MSYSIDWDDGTIDNYNDNSGYKYHQYENTNERTVKLVVTDSQGLVSSQETTVKPASPEWALQVYGNQFGACPPTGVWMVYDYSGTSNDRALVKPQYSCNTTGNIDSNATYVLDDYSYYNSGNEFLRGNLITTIQSSESLTIYHYQVYKRKWLIDNEY